MIATVQRRIARTLASVGMALWAGSAFAAETISAELKLRDGTAAGRVEIMPAPGGGFLRLKVTGLTPGGHAVKVHETGKCEGDFSSAGGILNPLGSGQGLLNDEGPAAGDLPNIFVGASGEAEVEFVTSQLQPGALEGDPLADEDGAAIVIYDKPDTHVGLEEALPIERVACGAINKK